VSGRGGGGNGFEKRIRLRSEDIEKRNLSVPMSILDHDKCYSIHGDGESLRVIPRSSLPRGVASLALALLDQFWG
jgi:hypothetical protein